MHQIINENLHKEALHTTQFVNLSIFQSFLELLTYNITISGIKNQHQVLSSS